MNNFEIKISILILFKYLKEHTEIFNAIKSKDSKNARKQVYHHLAGVKKDLLKN